MSIHPLDQWQLTAAGLDESEIDVARTERIRQQTTLDNRLAELWAQRRMARPSMPRDPAWMARAAWMLTMVVAGALMMIGLMVY